MGAIAGLLMLFGSDLPSWGDLLMLVAGFAVIGGVVVYIRCGLGLLRVLGDFLRGG